MNKIIVNNQAELDSISLDFRGEIHIQGILEKVNNKYVNAEVYVSGNAQIRYVYGNTQISYVYDNAQIRNVSGNAQISYVSGNAQISNVSGNAQIRNVSDNAQISNVYGNAQIRNVYGNAQIRYVSGNAQISYVYDNAQIRNVYDNAQISNVSGNAQISNVSGNAQISNVSGNVQISNVYGNAQIRNVSDNVQISNVSGNAQISNVSGNAQISNVYGNASILHCSGRSNIQTLGQNIISYNKSEINLKIDASTSTTIVILDGINATFDGYKKFYPFDVINGFAILYKAVHKTTDGKYISDKDSKFTYSIGEIKQHECNPSTKISCTYGLHVSHKFWALNFGNSWSDMALLEVRVPIDKIVVSEDCDGKVRTSELEVLREVLENEWY